jgi:hypothetical protein
VLATSAWRLADVADRLDGLTLRAWVESDEEGEGEGSEGSEGRGSGGQLIQDGTAGDLLGPAHWVDVLRKRGELEPGTVLISGTIPMLPGVDQFAAHWRVQLADPATGREIELAYRVVPMPEPIG